MEVADMKNFNDYIHNIRDVPAGGTRIQGGIDIRKSSDDRMQVFGWASISMTGDGQQVEDLQGDLIDPEDLEQAAYEYVLLYRDGGEMHEPTKRVVAKLIESVVFTEDKVEAMGLEPGALPVGWWIGFQVLDPQVWEKVKDGTYSMFSIEGTAQRVEVD
jgi:hypothetical protein